MTWLPDLRTIHERRPLKRALLVCFFAFLVACDTDGERREWAAADHQGEQKNRGQVSDAAEASEDATLVEVTWRQNCAVCHGLGGRGDTQQGQMLRIPDLTRADLAQLPDEALATTIRRGRNKMPSFDKLPEKVIAGLVRHVRSLAGAAARGEAAPAR